MVRLVGAVQSGFRAMRIRRIVLLILALECVAGCSTTGQLTLSTSEMPQLVLSRSSADCMADPPTNHMLAIDSRGNYRPIFAPCGGGTMVHQVRPDHLAEDGCQPVILSNPRIDPKMINDFSALRCQINRIIDALDKPVNGRPQHLVIFIHGGLVDQKEALNYALGDIPKMISDTAALEDFSGNPEGSGPHDILMKGSRLFPLFLNWPAGFLETYGDAITNYEQGIYDGTEREVEAPIYLGNDVAEVGARAPLDLLKSVHRYAGSEHELAYPDQGCMTNGHYGCNQIGIWQRALLDGSLYALSSPLRLVSVPMLDVATRAWKNMIARTRFGVDKYVDPQQYQRILQDKPAADATGDARQSAAESEILTKGAFYLLFEGFKERLYAEPNKPSCDAGAPRITLIGHSMGTMVANELLHEFPQLPYENIVYMAAATSVRDFTTMAEPVLRRPPCPDLRFYNLTLHQEWDARELELHGFVAPEGSLLEWIDDIFETPVTPADRTLGKWQNVVYAENEFDAEASGRMFFHRFGLGAPDPLMHGEFTQVATSTHSGCPAIPYWEPQFWAEVRVLEGHTCHAVSWLVQIDQGVPMRPFAEANAPEADR